MSDPLLHAEFIKAFADGIAVRDERNAEVEPLKVPGEKAR